MEFQWITPDDLWMLESPELKDPPEAAVKDSKTRWTWWKKHVAALRHSDKVSFGTLDWGASAHVLVNDGGDQYMYPDSPPGIWGVWSKPVMKGNR